MSLQTTEEIIKEAREAKHSVELTAFQIGFLQSILENSGKCEHVDGLLESLSNFSLHLGVSND